MKEEQKYNGSKTRNYFTAYLLAYFKMRDLEERLEKYYFVRCHNGIIVNVDCIESLHDLTTTLYSGAKIYITRSRKQNLMKKMAERGGSV